MATTLARGRRRLRLHRPVRALALLLCLIGANVALVLTATEADAHPLSTTAVLLDVGSNEVTGQVQLPIDRLAIALNQPTLTTPVAVQPAKLEELRQYVAAHLTATDAADDAPWDVTVADARVQTIDGVDHLVLDIALRPPDGAVRGFRLHDDAIVHRLLSHRIFVSVRAAGSNAYAVVGLLDWESHDLTVAAPGPGAEQGFLAAARLGVEHIAEGADHLLFLVMLLLPAPLLARHQRWARADDLRRQCFRVVHVVTAFAAGHSITLALAALGYVTVPTRAIESMIALSILVSGVHAIRPIVRGGEVFIAAGFGLMHGLAFAALLGDLDLARGSLVTELLGFNVGIELAQLIVVALIMPSLMALSRTQLYPAARVALAGLGIVLAAGWLAERTTLIAANPLERVPAALVAHPFIAAATLACVAVATWAVPACEVRRPAPEQVRDRRRG